MRVRVWFPSVSRWTNSIQTLNLRNLRNEWISQSDHSSHNPIHPSIHIHQRTNAKAPRAECHSYTTDSNDIHSNISTNRQRNLEKSESIIHPILNRHTSKLRCWRRRETVPRRGSFALPAVKAHPSIKSSIHILVHPPDITPWTLSSALPWGGNAAAAAAEEEAAIDKRLCHCCQLLLPNWLIRRLALRMQPGPVSQLVSHGAWRCRLQMHKGVWVFGGRRCSRSWVVDVRKCCGCISMWLGLFRSGCRFLVNSLVCGSGMVEFEIDRCVWEHVEVGGSSKFEQKPEWCD